MRGLCRRFSTMGDNTRTRPSIIPHGRTPTAKTSHLILRSVASCDARSLPSVFDMGDNTRTRPPLIAKMLSALSVITGGGTWVEISISADRLYRHLLLTAEKEFWRCVENGEP